MNRICSQVMNSTMKSGHKMEVILKFAKYTFALNTQQSVNFDALSAMYRRAMQCIVDSSTRPRTIYIKRKEVKRTKNTMTVSIPSRANKLTIYRIIVERK